MDPDAALERALLGDLESLQALHVWLKSGGFLPTEWKRRPHINIVRRSLEPHSSCCLDDEDEFAEVCESVQGLIQRL